jgi:hypothetical protein
MLGDNRKILLGFRKRKYNTKSNSCVVTIQPTMPPTKRKAATENKDSSNNIQDLLAENSKLKALIEHLDTQVSENAFRFYFSF